MYEYLSKAQILVGLTPQELQRLGESATERFLAKDERLFEEGDPGDACYFIIEGKLAITKRVGEREVVLAERGTGEVIGEMALIDDAPRSASITAREETRLMELTKSAFQNLLATKPAVALNSLAVFARRMRETETILYQNEKLAALGTMTAGVAHELNNPAAAARRAAEHLGQAVFDLQVAGLDLPMLNLSKDQVDAMRELRETLRTRAESPVYLDPLARSDLEYEMEEWLEAHGIDQAWEVAPLLVNAGYNSETITRLTDTFDSGNLPAIIKWLTSTYTSLSLLQDIGSSTKRLSEIIQAMKQYAYLDQAPIQEVDVHEGLDSTLILLGHRLREGITVTREYAEDLPRITAYGSELTQVWTNIIDNAVAAMGGRGNLHIRTRRQDEHAIIEISDDGPGIPEDVREHIFEPFFTTKAPGDGTGLGLHISHNIIVNNHGGQLNVSSQPGKTTFEIWLPIESEPVHQNGQ